MFNIFYAKDKAMGSRGRLGTNLAEQFLKGLDPYLTSMMVEYQNNLIQSNAQDPAAGTAMRVLSPAMQAVGGVTGTIAAITGQDLSSGLYLPTRIASQTRYRQNEDISKLAREAFGDFGGDATNFMLGVVDSIADNVFAMGTGTALAGEGTKAAMRLVQLIMSESASRDARALAQSANEIAKVWLGAYDEALTGVVQNERPDFSTMRESKAETVHDDATLENNKYTVANMDSVINLNGDEITIDEDHRTKAFALFGSLKGVESEAAGWVNLNKQEVRDSYGHGYGPLKVLLFASVPDVLKKGKIIAYTENRNDKGYDTAIIAAPVHVNKGKLEGDYYVGAIIKLYNDGHNKFYTHDGTAAITNKNGIAHLTAGPREGSGRRSDSHLLVNILNELNKYNGKNGFDEERLSRAEKIRQNFLEGKGCNSPAPLRLILA